MRFSSIADVANAFALQGYEPAEIRRRLRERQAAIHPDRYNGQFPSPEAEEEFHRIEEAISLLDSPSSATSLVPINAIPQIVRAVRDAMAPEAHANRQHLLQEKLEAQVDRSVDRYRPPLAGPRVTVTGLTAVLTAIWAFPTVVEGNPALQRLIDPSSPMFTMIWIYALATTALAWLLAWRQKEQHDRLASALKSEPHQNRVFREFLPESVGGQPQKFSKDDLVDFIRKRHRREYLNPLLRLLKAPEVDYETAQTVADLIVERLQSRGIIELSADRSLSTTYRLVEATDE